MTLVLERKREKEREGKLKENDIRSFLIWLSLHTTGVKLYETVIDRENIWDRSYTLNLISAWPRSLLALETVHLALCTDTWTAITNLPYEIKAASSNELGLLTSDRRPIFFHRNYKHVYKLESFIACSSKLQFNMYTRFTFDSKSIFGYIKMFSAINYGLYIRFEF